jgi:hypothetical protein
MESYKEDKIVSWSGKMHFSNHLPQMNIICRRWIPKKFFFWWSVPKKVLRLNNFEEKCWRPMVAAQSFQFFGFLSASVHFSFRIYEIYKGKYWFHSKKIEKLFLLKTCFLPIKSHKTWKKAIKFFPCVTRRRRRRRQNIFTRLQPRP